MKNEAISRLSTLSKMAQTLSYEATEDTVYVEMFEERFGQYFPIAEIEKILDVYKKRYMNIVQKQMPEIMIENEIEKIKLENGLNLSIKKLLSPKVIDQEKMIEWIESIDMGDTIKTQLTFGKGEVDENLKKFLNERGYSYTPKDDVHFQTLSKIIRDRYNSGDGLPPADAVQVTPIDIVEIK